MQRTKGIAKSPLHEALPEQKFREYYGIFRLGQYFTEAWTPLKAALVKMLSRATRQFIFPMFSLLALFTR